MKNIFLYILLLFIGLTTINTTKSQEFAPIGAIWHYGVATQTLVGINTNFIRLESVDSVLVSGKYYRRLISNASNGGLAPRIQHVREENGKVYILIGFEPQEHIMFDKNPNVGDIWYYPINKLMGNYEPYIYNFLYDSINNANDSIALKVLGVVDTVFNNQSAKIINVATRLTMHPENPVDTLFKGNDEIFSPYGFSTSFFLIHFYSNIIEFNVPVGINCYQDDYWGLIQPDTTKPCDYNLTPNNIEDFYKDLIHFFPNPSNGNFNITINQQGNYHLKIYNSVGQLITQSSFGMGNTAINLQSKNISAGLYFVEISNEQQQRLKIEKVLLAAE